MEHSKEELSTSEDHTIRLRLFENRWRFAVFPAMIMFVVLGAFGFYLIWGMLDRMQALSRDLTTMTKVISESMPVMQGGIVGMSSRMQMVGEDLEQMAEDVRSMSKVVGSTMPSMNVRLSEMANTINVMSYSTASMATTTDNMGRNIWNLNKSISKPMSFFGDMMPWGGSKNVTPPPPPMRPMPINYQRTYNYRQTVPMIATPLKPAMIKTDMPQVALSDEYIEIKSGENHYNGYCASCHGLNAEGGVGPELTNRSTKSLKEMLTAYKDGKLKGSTMPGVALTLSDEHINNVSRYISSRFFKGTPKSTSAIN